MNLLAKAKTLSWKLCSRMLAGGRRAGLVLAQLNPNPAVADEKLVALPTAKLGFRKPPAEGVRPGAMGPATIVGKEAVAAIVGLRSMGGPTVALTAIR